MRIGLGRVKVAHLIEVIVWACLTVSWTPSSSKLQKYFIIIFNSKQELQKKNEIGERKFGNSIHKGYI